MAKAGNDTYGSPAGGLPAAEEARGAGATQEGLSALATLQAERIIDFLENMVNHQEKSYYDVLGLDSSATPMELKDKFHEIRQHVHPDRFASRVTAQQLKRLSELFERLQQIYRILIIPVRRVAYDISIGVLDTDYVTPAEQEAKHKLFREYRRQFVVRFRDRVRKAEKYYREALIAIDDKRMAVAHNWLNLAITFDPLNESYRAKLKEILASDRSLLDE